MEHSGHRYTTSSHGRRRNIGRRTTFVTDSPVPGIPDRSRITEKKRWKPVWNRNEEIGRHISRRRKFQSDIELRPVPPMVCSASPPGTDGAGRRQLNSLSSRRFLRKYPGRSHCVEESHVCCGHTSSTAKKRYSTIAPYPKRNTKNAASRRDTVGSYRSE